MKKFKVDKNKKILACVLSGSLLIPSFSMVGKTDAFYDGNKIVIEEYGKGKIEINKDMFESELKIGDVFVNMDMDDYDYYLNVADKHEKEKPYYYLSAFGILGGISAMTLAISKVLEKKINSI